MVPNVPPRYMVPVAQSPVRSTTVNGTRSFRLWWGLGYRLDRWRLVHDSGWASHRRRPWLCRLRILFLPARAELFGSGLFYRWRLLDALGALLVGDDGRGGWIGGGGDVV